MVYGFDYYRHRFTRFIFYTGKSSLLKKNNYLPKYYLTDFLLENNNCLILKGESNEKIKIDLKNNPTLQTSLTDKKMLNFLNGIMDKPNNNLI